MLLIGVFAGLVYSESTNPCPSHWTPGSNDLPGFSTRYCSLYINSDLDYDTSKRACKHISWLAFRRGAPTNTEDDLYEIPDSM